MQRDYVDRQIINELKLKYQEELPKLGKRPFSALENTDDEPAKIRQKLSEFNDYNTKVFDGFQTEFTKIQNFVQTWNLLSDHQVSKANEQYEKLRDTLLKQQEELLEGPSFDLDIQI